MRFSQNRSSVLPLRNKTIFAVHMSVLHIKNLSEIASCISEISDFKNWLSFFVFFFFLFSHTYKNFHKIRTQYPIGQFHVRESILIDLLIVVAQPLDAVVSHKNVQKSLGNGQPRTQNLLSHRI